MPVIVPFWKRSSELKAELGLLELVERVAVRAEEGQVGREIITELGVALELGNDRATSFEELVQVVVDILVGELGDRSLDLEALVVGQLELRTNLDVHLEAHRPVIGNLDRLDVEPRLNDRLELVVLVDLLERRHQQVRLDLLRDLLLEPLDDQLPRRTARPKARDGGILPQ